MKNRFCQYISESINILRKITLLGSAWQLRSLCPYLREYPHFSKRDFFRDHFTKISAFRSEGLFYISLKNSFLPINRNISRKRTFCWISLNCFLPIYFKHINISRKKGRLWDLFLINRFLLSYLGFKLGRAGLFFNLCLKC